MSDLQKIHGLIGRTRGRLRRQAALEWGTTALVPALAGSLVVLWLWRMEYLTDPGALGIVLALGGVVLATAVVGALRSLPTHLVATRLDRASNLSDRLATAVEFEKRLGDKKQIAGEHPDTVAFMEAAVADASRAVARANPKAAAPYGAPKDLGAVAVFGVLVLVVGMLAFSPDHRPPSVALVDDTGGNGGLDLTAADDKALDPDDVDYSRQYVKDLRDMADQTNDPYLKKFAEELEALLDKAEKGEISKEELLAKMEELEKKYMEGSEQDETAMLEDLKDTGKELKKEPLTKRLGEALESGDMSAAQKEMQRLAEQIENKELSPKDQKKIAEAIQKVEKKREQKQDKQDTEAQKKIQKKKDEIRKLQKQADKDPKNEENKRRLDKEKRELEKLERNQQDKKEQAKKRSLERLHRKMKDAAENMQNQKPEAAKDMKDGAEEANNVENEIKKIENQKRAQSQLGDLKDSIRRAKQKKGDGTQKGRGQKQARLQKIKEWEDRASGRGQGKGQGKGQGQGEGQGEGKGEKGPGKGGGKGGDGYGDEHDENLMGDPTKLTGHKKDEKLDGVNGRGPSRRETILTSAKKGFSSTAYKRVYADYKKIVEDVMSQEKVPQGYKYYVKRYFNRIKPHSMD